MVRGSCFGISIVAASHAVSKPAWCGISQKYHVSLLSMLGHCFDDVSLGKGLYPLMVQLSQV